MRIDSAGDVVYRSTPDSADQSGETYELEFTSSIPVRNRIFSLIQRVRFPDHATPLNPDLPGSIATIQLRTENGDKEATYRDTSDRATQQLTSVFQRISKTIEFGRRIGKLHDSKEPAISAELSRMLAFEKRGGLLEIQAVVPTLNSVISDQSLARGVRQKAEAVLKSASGGKPATRKND